MILGNIFNRTPFLLLKLGDALLNQTSPQLLKRGENILNSCSVYQLHKIFLNQMMKIWLFVPRCKGKDLVQFLLKAAVFLTEIRSEAVGIVIKSVFMSVSLICASLLLVSEFARKRRETTLSVPGLWLHSHPQQHLRRFHVCLLSRVSSCFIAWCGFHLVTFIITTCRFSDVSCVYDRIQISAIVCSTVCLRSA